MQATIINENNSEAFLGAVDTESLVNSDLFFGAVDEKSDAAVGVLAVGAGGNHTLAIRFIYVDEEYRRQGAGSSMLSLLTEVAYDMEAEAIVCALFISEEELEIRDFLLAYGFLESESEEDDMVLLTYDLLKESLE